MTIGLNMVLETLRPTEASGDDGFKLYKSWVSRYPGKIPRDQVPIVFRLRDAGMTIEGLRANEQLKAVLDGLSPEERELCENALRDAKSINQYAVLCNLRWVIHLAGRLLKVRKGLPLMDAIQEGNLGLRRSVEKFDCERNITPSTYFTWGIKQAISRAAEKQPIIPFPSYLEAALFKARRAANKFEQENGRLPKKDELVELLEAEGVKSTAARTAADIFESPMDPVSLDTVVGDKEDGTTLKDFIAAPDSVEGEVIGEELAAKLGKLPERHRRVLELRVQGKTLKEAGRELGITRERARQIEAKALGKLKASLSWVPSDFDAQEVEGREEEKHMEAAELPRSELGSLCTPDSDRRVVNAVFLKNVEKWGQAVVDYAKNAPEVWNSLTDFEKTFLGLYFGTDTKERELLKQRLAIIFETSVFGIEGAVLEAFLNLKENIREFLQNPSSFEKGILDGLPEEENGLTEAEKKELVLTEKELSALLWSIQNCSSNGGANRETHPGLARKLMLFIRDKQTVFLANAANPEAQRVLTLAAWLQSKKDISELLG